MTTREAFEKGTATFNAHDMAGFATVLADDVEFTAPGGIAGKGRDACAAFFGGWI
jgi:ketosteroid isomerase-like protein